MAVVKSLERWHQTILNQLEVMGLDIHSVRQKKHKVVSGELNGKPFRWVTSTTPSATVAYKRMLADLRRELRKCGVNEIPEFSMKFTQLPSAEETIWNTIRKIEIEIDL